MMLKNIKKHINKESLRDLYRLNVLSATFVSICSLFYLLLFEDRKVVVIMAIKSGLYMLIASFMLVYILRFCILRFSDNLFLFRFWRYFLSYVAGICLYLFFWHIFASYAGILSRSNTTKWMFSYALFATIIITVLLVLHDFVIVRRAKIQSDLEVARQEMRSQEAENLLLRQQIHPHFLFNALSTLKSLINTDPEKCEYYLLHLAEFLRIAISHNRSLTSTFREELSICENYLEMQKIRFHEAMEWEVSIENKKMLEGHLPSFALQPLIENAIKHNVFTLQHPIKIMIRQYGDMVEVSNNINLKQYGENSTRSGLSNLSERYFLLTGENINITDDGKTFTVGLKIINK